MSREPRLRLRDNPLLVAQARRRLRLRQTLPGVLIVVVLGICAVLFAAVDGDRDAWRGLEAFALVVIGLLLFLRAPLRLAGVVADERHGGLLDFHRATPTSAWTDAVGYLLGVPAREYLLAAVLLPFLLVGTVAAGDSLPAALGVVAVFALSGVLYHAFALVAGLAFERRWSAVGVVVIAVVLVLSAWVPFVESGFTAFAFLTPFPAVGELLTNDGNFGAVGIDVGFFGLRLPATAFTVLVQGWLLAFLLQAAVRRVRRDDAPLLSRPGAFLFLATGLLIAVGSAWPDPSGAFAERFDWEAAEVGLAYLVVAGGAATLLVLALTPSFLDFVRGERRARKAGRRHAPWLRDGASAWPLPLGMGAIVLAGLALLSATAPSGMTGRLALSGWPLLAVLTLTGFLAFLSGMAEYVRLAHRRSYRSMGLLFGFLTLILPWIVSGIVAAGSGGHRGALWPAGVSPTYAVVHTLVGAAADWTGDWARLLDFASGPLYLSAGATLGFAALFHALAAAARARAAADPPPKPQPAPPAAQAPGAEAAPTADGR
jgi:hypothetical protein